MAQARLAIDAGAQFLVSPGANPVVVEFAQREGVPIIPGLAPSTEIEANLARGIEVMTLFPAEVLGGVRFLEAVFAPYRNARFMPTGGIGPANLAGYLRQPNLIACGGSWIAPRGGSWKPGSSRWSQRVPARRPSSSGSRGQLDRVLTDDGHLGL